MTRTLAAAAQAAAHADGGVSDILKAASRGALFGAAGNSGVILAQLLRGISDAVGSDDCIDLEVLKRGFRGAVALAYTSVAEPVEGTILTVARKAAESIENETEIVSALAAAHNAAKRAVAETPGQLPKLREAGVVDAGGEGLRIILDGLARWVRGQSLTSADNVPELPISRTIVGQQNIDVGIGYCTQFVIERPVRTGDELRDQLRPLTNSLIVIEADGVIRVHAHSTSPGRVLDAGIDVGSVSQISIEDMTRQHATAALESAESSGALGVITTAPSPESAEVLRSLGAALVIEPAGPSPTVDEILQAIQATAFNTLVLLPNDRNAMMAANQAIDLSRRSVQMVATRDVAEAAQCLLQMQSDTAADDIIERMENSLTRALSVTLAHAVRPVNSDLVPVQINDVIALADNKIVAATPELESTLDQLWSSLNGRSFELATVYTGTDALEGEQEATAQWFARSHDEVEVEIVEANIPGCVLLLSLE